MRSKAYATRQDFSIESTASSLMSGDVLGSRNKHTVYSTKLIYSDTERRQRKAQHKKCSAVDVGLNEYYSLIVALLRKL